jgi:hypothetical protein
VSLLGALRAAVARTGTGVWFDQAAQEEALRLCLASASARRRARAARRGRGGGTADPDPLSRALGFVPSRSDGPTLAKLLGF